MDDIKTGTQPEDAEATEAGRTTEEQLAGLRSEIDRIDRQLLSLLNERFDKALEIAQIKHAAGLEIYDPERESNILRQLSMQLGESDALIEIISVFEGMLKLSKKAQLKYLSALEKNQTPECGKSEASQAGLK